MLICSNQLLNNVTFNSKSAPKSKDVSIKTKLKAPKVSEARQLKFFIDELQLIPECQRPYYSEQMMRAKIKPGNLKGFVSKILKIV